MQIEQSRLESGLTVLTVRLTGFDSASVAAVVNAGSRVETEANNGIAHFLEHMAFKGTRRRSAARIAAEVELHGAHIGAFTSQAMTAYYVSGLAETVPVGLGILGDVLTDSLLAPADIDMERGVILQEIKRAEDNPQSVAGRIFAATAYPDQPTGRTILGRPEFIRAAGREDFLAFLAAHYHAGNMAVVGAGDLDHAAFRDQVAEAFAALPVRGGRSRPEPARWVGGYAGDTSRAFEQVQVLLGFPSVPVTDPGFYAHRAAVLALGSGLSSPLFREMREKRGLVYATYMASDHQPDHGDVVLYGGMTTANLDEFMRVAADLLARADEEITEQDFIRARNAMLVWLATEKERPFQVALHVVKNLFDTGRLLDPGEERRKVEALTLEELRAAARAWAANPPTLAMVGPFDTSRDWYSELRAATGAPAPVAEPQASPAVA